MTTVFCKTTNIGEQSFYICCDRNLYFLFTQKYRKSNKEYFERGVFLDKIYDFSHVHSAATKSTLEKIRRCIPQIERQEGVVLRKQAERKYFGTKTLSRQKGAYCNWIEEY